MASRPRGLRVMNVVYARGTDRPNVGRRGLTWCGGEGGRVLAAGGVNGGGGQETEESA